MSKSHFSGLHRTAYVAGAVAAVVCLSAQAAPVYTINQTLVAEDQFQGEENLTPAPVFKPHETGSTLLPLFWISSNERDNKAGISVFRNGNNAVLSEVNIEFPVCLPVVKPDGQPYGCAPAGAEDHPRHPHGIAIDDVRRLAYQVIEHSGLKWNQSRTGFELAQTTDEESGLLLVYNIADPRNPKILEGYVLGHAAEEDAVNRINGKVYAGNHEPSPTNVACFVSVIDRANKKSPYRFIDLPSDQDCVQGVGVDEPLQMVFGTTHIGQKMFAFNSSKDTIAYSVDIRAAFDQFTGLDIPADWVIHMHDLVADPVNHRAYQTIHTIASPVEVEEEEEDTDTEVIETPETAGDEGTGTTDEAADDEITGRWVAEVNVNPRSRNFKQVTIIDLSNGQPANQVPTHEDAVATGLPFNRLFVHAHFVAVDPLRKALMVSGEHTGNLGIVDTNTRQLQQVLTISRRIPGCTVIDETGQPVTPEPHVHGVDFQALLGTAYVSDEGEDCFYESVTILRP